MGKKPSETSRVLVASFVGVIFGFLVGVSTSLLSGYNKLNPVTDVLPQQIGEGLLRQNQTLMNEADVLSQQSRDVLVRQNQTLMNEADILPQQSGDGLVRQNQTLMNEARPKGAERLPSGIVVTESDYYLRRLWGDPSEDLTTRPNYLVTFTVGYDLMHNIDAAVKKFSEDFTIVLFHYDGRASEWDVFEWSKKAIHISARKQTKWWFAKRFLHPDIVAPYDYIFIWDEDLGLEQFDAQKYIDMVKKYGLEISQPGLESNSQLTWMMTERKVDSEVHKETTERPGWCTDPHLPPCAGFVEIMAPVFSRDAWRCVWHIVQNDLVHGWGLDFALQKCVQPPHEKIGVVDSQWIVHQRIPSLGNQGDNNATGDDAPWRGVRLRCEKEWQMFKTRLENAEHDEQAKNIKGS